MYKEMQNIDHLYKKKIKKQGEVTRLKQNTKKLLKDSIKLHDIKYLNYKYKANNKQHMENL